MLRRLASSRLAVALVSATLAAGAASGISVAIAGTRDASPDLYYACVGTAGTSLNKVKSGTMRLNVPPTKCPTTTDVIKSWNAQGAQGLQGPVGPRGEPGSVGVVYSASMFKFTSEGCPLGQGKFVVSRTWGAEMDWQPAANPQWSGRCADAESTPGGLGGLYWIPRDSMPDGVWVDETSNSRVNYVRVGTDVYTFECSGRYDGSRVWNPSGYEFRCDFTNYTKPEEPTEAANARFYAALSHGIEVGPVEFMTVAP